MKAATPGTLHPFELLKTPKWRKDSTVIVVLWKEEHTQNKKLFFAMFSLAIVPMTGIIFGFTINVKVTLEFESLGFCNW